MAFRLSPLAKAFLGFSVFLFLFTTALTIWRIVDFFQRDELNYSDVIMAFVLLVNLGFFLYYAFKGAVYEVREDLFAFAFAAILLTFYETYQFVSKLLNDKLELIFYVRFAGVVVLGPIVLVLVALVYREFGWRDFKTVGSDMKLLTMYRQFNRYCCLLEIDLQLGLSLVTFGVVGFLVIEEEPLFSLLEIIGYGIYAGVTILWVILGYFGAKRESMIMMIIWLIFSIVEPAYIIFYLVNYLLNQSTSDPNRDLVLLMMIIGGFAFLIRILLVAMSIMVMRNFGAGLKKRVWEKYQSDDVTERSPLNVDL